MVGNEIGDEGAKMVADLMEKSHSIQVLYLNGL